MSQPSCYAEIVFPVLRGMPVAWIEPEDVSYLVVYLVSDE
ncbi:hypothetical protein X011_00595 [Mycobacterium tuberculosis variant microti OV254]|nr:hypothetical protein X011_00595 [Mycobacterium tuberculosis variant microti OV254]